MAQNIYVAITLQFGTYSADLHADLNITIKWWILMKYGVLMQNDTQ